MTASLTVIASQPPVLSPSDMTRDAPLLTIVIVLALFPPVAQALDGEFYIGLASRIMIYAIAVTSLNLLIGYGGMLSFGHAAFVGVGAYAVAILAHHGVDSAWLAWPVAILGSAIAALVIGAISLRTRGVYFIMITLAFAQMLYYFFVGFKTYGGDDGISLTHRSAIGWGFDLADARTFYYVVLIVLSVSMWLFWRLTEARFGWALRGIKENETRMEAIGFPTFRLKLACFVIAGAAAGLAGALLVNQNSFVSPRAMHWTQSGTLMIMAILGGVGHRLGGVIGATLFLMLEEILSMHTTHWHLPLGAILLLVVFFAPRGVAGSLRGAWAR
jgi:branched-chain amino acid transport system permease protein